MLSSPTRSPKLPDIITVQSRGRFIRNGLFCHKVLSRHDKAVNLLDRERNLLVSLVADSSMMTDMSLMVPSLFNSSRFHERDVFSQSDFDFSSAANWSGKPLSGRTDPVTIQKSRRILTRYIPPDNSLLTLFHKGENTIWQKKAREILGKNPLAYGNLIGLGIGMTPSGDDFVTGALLADILTEMSRIPGREKIGKRLGSTTPAGRTLVHLALKDSFPAYLLHFADNLYRGRTEKELVCILTETAEHGATSGRDALAGFYWHLDQLNSPISE